MLTRRESIPACKKELLKLKQQSPKPKDANVLDTLLTFDAWLFYFLHWAEIGLYLLVAGNALYTLWDTYGC